MYDIDKNQLMKVKVIGAELKEGDYQGNHYKNYIIYTVSPVKRDSELFGVCPSSVKIRAKWVDDNEINIKALNGKIVDMFYDAYGHIAKIDIVE